MRLKKLSLQGYKTFATRTDFLFDGNITAVVGPNGSGKSNIADAIRWVLGEQSYLTLRGKRTTDMIFAGGRKRPRAGMAQAVLTLDNSEGWLPIDFSEIEIGRRAFRSGENEYLLNGQKVRLRDVSDLLANSGLAERTYTIIGQGLIDKALSLRPDERRALFEEAAGIGLYKSKKIDSIRKLEETQHNLERVHDILAEITPNLRRLRRQSSRARNYNQVASDLRFQLRLWYGFRWQQERKLLKRKRDEQEAAAVEWDTGRAKLSSLKEQIDEQRHKTQQHRTLVQNIQDERDIARGALEDARRIYVVTVERQSRIEKELERVEERLSVFDDSIEQAAKMYDNALQELKSAELQKALAESTLVRFNADFGAESKQIQDKEALKEGLEADLSGAETAQAKLEGQLIQLHERLLSLNSSRIDPEDILKAKETKIVSEETVNKSTENLNKIMLQRKQIAKNFTEIETEYRALQSALEKTSIRSAELRTEIVQLKTRQEMLGKESPEFQKYEEDHDIIGSLSDLVSTQPSYSKALTAAFSTGRGALLVETVDALWRLIDYGKEENTSLVAAVANSNTQDELSEKRLDIGTPLIDLVDIDKEHHSTAAKILSEIYLIDDPKVGLANIEDLPNGTLLVTKDGIVIQSGGLVAVRSTEEASRLENERKLRKQLEIDLSHAQSDLTKLARRQSAELDEIEIIRRSRETLSQNLNQLRDEEQNWRETLNQEKLLQDRTQRDYVRLVEQRESEIKQEKLLKEQIQTLTIKLEEVGKRLDEIRNQQIQVQEQLRQLPVTETKHEMELISQQLESAKSILAGRLAVVDSRRASLEQIQDQKNQAETHKSELKRQKESIQLDQHQAQVGELESRYQDLEQALFPANKQVNDAQNLLRDLERDLDSQLQTNSKFEELFTQARIDYAQQENRVESLKERIQIDLGLVDFDVDEDEISQSPLPMSDVVDQLPFVEDIPADIEETIQQLRGQLTRMGAVNPDAPAEYEELRERRDFLVSQVADLEETSGRLREIIDDLDDLTSRSFAKTVAEVDLEFRKVFTRLFGGGAAQLVLTDPDDVAVSGVDIVARLPGRREQNLGLLSGGERALTAAALIFSLLKVSPTPFCVLDEVDAMLDDANIRRFRDMLSELSQNTQFVVITHNRGTVQAADNVYGVSMSADSASQVISLKPEDYVTAPGD